MRVNFQAKNIEITPAIQDYAVKRVTDLGKLLSQLEERGGETQVLFDFARTTKHKGGEIFHADCLVKVQGKDYYSSADKEDLYEAIDEIKDKLYMEINKNKNKRQTLFKRGASSVKKMMKGLSKRNPFTSKY